MDRELERFAAWCATVGGNITKDQGSIKCDTGKDHLELDKGGQFTGDIGKNLNAVHRSHPNSRQETEAQRYRIDEQIDRLGVEGSDLYVSGHREHRGSQFDGSHEFNLHIYPD